MVILYFLAGIAATAILIFISYGIFAFLDWFVEADDKSSFVALCVIGGFISAFLYTIHIW